MKKVWWTPQERQLVLKHAESFVKQGEDPFDAIRLAQQYLPMARQRKLRARKEVAGILTALYLSSNISIAQDYGMKKKEMGNLDGIITDLAKLLTQQFKDKLYDALIKELKNESSFLK